jgi:hypothetical protein
MLKKSIQDAIFKGIEKGIYKSVALVKVNEKGERIFLLTHSKNPKERFEHIKIQLEKKLGPGVYSIECNTGNYRSSFKDCFEVIIKEPVLISLNNQNKDSEIIDETQNQETMNEINFEDYINLIKDKERLTAQNALLLTQLEIEQKKNGNVSLNDSSGGTIGEKVINSLSENIPMVLSIFDKWMAQRDKDLELRERALNDKTGNKMIQKKINGNHFSKENLISHLEDLYLNNPEEFEKSLDKIQQTDPDLYNYCLQSLGLEETEEEEETEI